MTLVVDHEHELTLPSLVGTEGIRHLLSALMERELHLAGVEDWHVGGVVEIVP